MRKECLSQYIYSEYIWFHRTWHFHLYKKTTTNISEKIHENLKEIPFNKKKIEIKKREENWYVWICNLISSRLIETMNPIPGVYFFVMDDKNKVICLEGNFYSF